MKLWMSLLNLSIFPHGKNMIMNFCATSFKKVIELVRSELDHILDSPNIERETR